ncbi:MAG: thymidylate kinase [Acidobacteriia bacterium]|nr:thymidylate kinase [Terriglobia bacterium]
MPDYKARPPLSYYRTALPGVDYSELQGKLIVIEGPDAVGRSTQIRGLKPWLEEAGHAVLDTGMARSALAGKGIKEAKQGNTLGPVTMTMYYLTDFADRLENEIIPALRAGVVVLTDRYIYSVMARAIARGENRAWIEKTAGFALVPHAVFYLRAEVQDLITRVVVGRGAFDYWESGLDNGFGHNMYDSFVRYQSRLIRVFDSLAVPYGFEVIDATRPPVEVFESLKTSVSRIFEPQEKSQAEHPRKPAQRVDALPNVKSASGRK